MCYRNAFSECRPVACRSIQSFNPGVDRLVGDLLVLGPARDETPAQRAKRPFVAFRIHPDREDALSSCDVVTDRQIELRWDRNSDNSLSVGL